MVQESLIGILEQLKEILLKEKDALIKNESKVILDLVSKKETLIGQLENVEIEIDQKDEVQKRVAEIRELQETNAMLTEQAMNYAYTFIDAFQKEAQKSSTYSKEGSLKNSKNSGILDQSL